MNNKEPRNAIGLRFSLSSNAGSIFSLIILVLEDIVQIGHNFRALWGALVLLRGDAAGTFTRICHARHCTEPTWGDLAPLPKIQWLWLLRCQKVAFLLLPLQTYQVNTSYYQEICRKMKASKFINLIIGMTVLSSTAYNIVFKRESSKCQNWISSKWVLIVNFNTEVPSTNRDGNHAFLSLVCIGHHEVW